MKKIETKEVYIFVTKGNHLQSQELLDNYCYNRKHVITAEHIWITFFRFYIIIFI